MKTGNQITGIILAGGQGSRLGRDKGLIGLNGKSLAEHAMDVLSPFCNKIMISSNNPGYHVFPCEIVPDRLPGYGPMMGISSALKASSTTMNLVLAVDNVFVTREFFNYLISRDLSNHQVAVPFVKNNYFEPLVGYYSRTCLPVMEEMMQESNYKLPDLFSRVSVEKLMVETDFPAFHPDYFHSLNHPEDLLLLHTLKDGHLQP